MHVKYRRQETPQRTRPFSTRVIFAVLVLLSAGAVKAAWPTVAALGHTRVPASAIRTRYVAIPHPADTESRRRGAYLARKLNLPLIAEPGVKEVVIKEFKK